VTVNVKSVVWFFRPSVFATSPTLIRGSSSTTVPAPCPSVTTEFAGGEVDDERLVRLAEPVAGDQDGDGLAGLAGGEGQRPARRLVVAARGRGTVARGVGD
jgi:hypothetical protein